MTTRTGITTCNYSPCPSPQNLIHHSVNVIIPTETPRQRNSQHQVLYMLCWYKDENIRKVQLLFKIEFNITFQWLEINSNSNKMITGKESNHTVSCIWRWLKRSFSFPNLIKQSVHLWGKSAECLKSKWVLRSSICPVEYSQYWHK